MLFSSKKVCCLRNLKTNQNDPVPIFASLAIKKPTDPFLGVAAVPLAVAASMYQPARNMRETYIDSYYHKLTSIFRIFLNYQSN